MRAVLQSSKVICIFKLREKTAHHRLQSSSPCIYAASFAVHCQSHSQHPNPAISGIHHTHRQPLQPGSLPLCLFFHAYAGIAFLHRGFLHHGPCFYPFPSLATKPGLRESTSFRHLRALSPHFRRERWVWCKDMGGATIAVGHSLAPPVLWPCRKQALKKRSKGLGGEPSLARLLTASHSLLCSLPGTVPSTVALSCYPG